MSALALARRGDEAAFRELTDPYRRELQLHCYRIVGSIEDAEDLVQETLLAAWRGLDGFEERASLRSWLYRIATNRSLNALRDGTRRPRTADAEPDFEREPPAASRIGEPLFMQPYPDALLDGAVAAPGPEARYEAKEAVALAFVAGLQHLPPRQRAALVLRDVLGFRAAEAAEMLETSEAAVASALQRARGSLDGRLGPADRERAPLPRSAQERELVQRFADAFVAGDINSVVALLTDDAWLTMPPVPLEYQGPETIGRFLATVPARGELDRFRLVPTRANGQPAFGLYLRDPACSLHRAAGVLVLTLAGPRISAITAFHDTAAMARFGLPRTLPA